MTIKDFKPGQTAYIVGKLHGTDELHIQETTVRSIGRKYVSTSAPGMRFKEENGGRDRKSFSGNEDYGNCLIEDKSWGIPSHLFPDIVTARDFVERENLSEWFWRLNNGWNKPRFTLEQLRQVKAILDPGGDKHERKTEPD